jgi:tRNA modification GTPase
LPSSWAQCHSICGCHWAAWARQCGESPIRIAAVECLTQARTERAAAILLDQYRGALALALGQIVEHLTARRLEAAAAMLETLLENARVGRHLTHPWKVVLVGKPNAGKSSLMNALLGYERTLVFAEPGTTRDVVTASAAMDGWPVELADTAGLRAGRDDIETIGIQRASDCLAGAELVVVVHDATLPWSDVEMRLCHVASAVVVAHNKTDLNPACVTKANGVRTSATLGQGIEELRERITRALVPRPPSSGSAVPFSVDLSKAIEQAYAAALRSDPQLAIQLLHDTIGSSDSVVS